MDYSLCTQTVTIYRETGNGISRQEIPGCFLQWQEEESYDRLGRKKEKKFLLIQPGTKQLVFSGDWVYNGVGPEVDTEIWRDFRSNPETGLTRVSYASPYWWQGSFCHTEAGRK